MLLSEYAYVFFYSSIVTFLLNTDVVMLRSLGNDRNLAEFGAGFRYYSVLTIVLTSVHTLFLPLVQKTNSFEKIIDIVNQHHKLVLLLIPIILIGIVLAPFIFPIIDGGKYPNSVYVFQILSVSALISFAFSPHSNFLMKYKRFKYLLAIVSIGFVIHIIANLFVIPKFHEIGAAIVNTAIYGFVNYMFYRKSKKLIANEKAQLESGAVK
jgi:O-antigen/teichoic acid export membrane protein